VTFQGYGSGLFKRQHQNSDGGCQRCLFVIKVRGGASAGDLCNAFRLYGEVKRMRFRHGGRHSLDCDKGPWRAPICRRLVR
jgi:hypothetical protein